MKAGYKHNQVDFFDISDYARPLAVWIAHLLKNTWLKAYHITFFHFGLSLIAVYWIQTEEYQKIILASLFLLLKNIFDAVDGSLARLQDRPSRVGRFLDSNLDFIGNILIFAVLPGLTWPIKGLAFLSLILQGTLYNYWSINHQLKNKSSSISKVKEDADSNYPYDNPLILKVLFKVYLLFYGWQDFIIEKFFRNRRQTLSNRDMTLLSINGLGFQQIILIVSLLLSHAEWAAYWFLLMNAQIILVYVKTKKDE